jgi:hypothetical protein
MIGGVNGFQVVGTAALEVPVAAIGSFFVLKREQRQGKRTGHGHPFPANGVA